MALFEEDLPRRRRIHEIGQDLSAISVDELRERVVQLRDEIARIETEIASKGATRTAADAIFRR